MTNGLDPRAVVDRLLVNGFGPFAGVPCSFLGPLISCLQDRYPEEYVTATNEGEALAISAGAWLAGRRPVMIMQNSGLGNAVNPLTSLCHTLRIPVLLLVTWRGEPGRSDEPQHELMGRITPDLLTAMQIRHELLPSDEATLRQRLIVAAEHMDRTRMPFAFVVPKGAVAAYPAGNKKTPKPTSMLRAVAIDHVVQEVGEEALLVATTGKTARELEGAWDRPQNLYIVGSMGCASSVALGVALNTPHRQVVVLDGDGAALMRMEAIVTIGRLRPRNLLHILLDNESYESTGGQPTHSGDVDFAGVAAACGYPGTAEADSADSLRNGIRKALSAGGPQLVRVLIAAGSDPGLGRPTLAPSASAARFQEAITR